MPIKSVSYGREVIIITGEFKNQRVRIDAVASFDAPMTGEDAFSVASAELMELGNFVDKALADKVVEIKRRLVTKTARAERRRALADEGLDVDDEVDF